MITDFQTHAFPDAVADRAIRILEARTDEPKAHLDGRLSSLLVSMDRAGIDRCVVASIATRPEQFGAILAWSERIRSPRVVPFPSFHPRDPQAEQKIATIHARGFVGIKLHPYYQDFVLDAEAMGPLYERIARLGLMLLCHLFGTDSPWQDQAGALARLGALKLGDGLERAMLVENPARLLDQQGQ
mgnify:CR=1 FL=1